MSYGRAAGDVPSSVQSPVNKGVTRVGMLRGISVVQGGEESPSAYVHAGGCWNAGRRSRGVDQDRAPDAR
ncbi:hypothetical protein JK361_40010 [Streptomyces sp. 5-8]|uniref:Uncharacterized protein n=1 Tax=Streptomyces musisoli TaxID=2802280 RepID=A0ABS1PEF5_9ACTN|nr:MULTISPECIES: DUF6233 domain-containing protein [Streptomyces]MBL1110654.1 hypothetical protein [Streptomyces musisoli]